MFVFSVFFSVATEQTEEYNVDDIITFHHTFSNVNPGTGGWDPDTNIFTCPLDGYYMFLVSLVKRSSDENFSYEGMASLRISDGEGYSHVVKLDYYGDDEVFRGISFVSFMQSILYCSSGQRVWLAMDKSCYLYGSSDYLSQFSGFIVPQGTYIFIYNVYMNNFS